jgi:hypothetical protein
MPETRSFDERLLRWGQRWAERNPQLHNSAVVKNVLEELQRLRARQSLRLDNDSIAAQIARSMEQVMPSHQSIAQRIRPIWNRLSRSRLGDIRLPNIELPRPSLPAVNLPAPGLSAPADSHTGLVLLILAGAAAVAILSGRMYRNAKKALNSDLAPVRAAVFLEQFDAKSPIRTRQDLVRAFEQLSLRELGPDAEKWNHRVIAARLGGGETERQRVAARLAHYYERARYAPEIDAVSPEWLGAAQREIAYLAGDASA